MPARDRTRPFWSKWVWKDWDAKTQDLDPYEYTAYHRLLFYAATCSADLCSIPDDDVRLARAIRYTLKRWRSCRPRVITFWSLQSDARYIHERLRDDAKSWLEMSANNKSRVNAALSERATVVPRKRQPDAAHARGGQKLEVRSKSLEEESIGTQRSNAAGPSAACFHRMAARFPSLDLPVIEAKMLAYHERHPYKSLDLAMVNWCKKAEANGWDQRNGNGAVHNDINPEEAHLSNIRRILAEKEATKKASAK